MSNTNNGSVVRVVKDRDYTVMKNIHLKDPRLSLKAVGLLCKVLSLPDNWEYSISGLVAICKEGRDTVRTTLHELKEFGYLQVNKLQKENGQFVYEYIIHETPIDVECENPVTESPDTESPDVDNQTELNTNILNTKELNTNILSAEAPKGQLINTGKKPKKPKMNGYIEVIQNLSSNEQIRNALLEYCNFRRGRGLTVKQWQIIVSKFKKDSEGKSVDEVLKCIELCLINGRNSLYYSDYPDNTRNKLEPVPDNNPSVIRRSR